MNEDDRSQLELKALTEAYCYGKVMAKCSCAGPRDERLSEQ